GRRYYDPECGCFITKDPLGDRDGPNLYAFVSNNPLTHVDLFGLFTFPAFLTGGPLLSSISQESPISGFEAAPRFQGAMQAAGGATEAYMGGAMALASYGTAAPVGFAIMTHGLDHFFTGLQTVWSGEHVETATSQLLQKTWMSSETAEL